jgi:hypothetical protein
LNMTWNGKNLLRLFMALVLLCNAVVTSVAMAGHHGTMGMAMQTPAGVQDHDGSMVHAHEGHESMGTMQHTHDSAAMDEPTGGHAADNCCQVGACCAAIATTYDFMLNPFRAPFVMAYDPSIDMIALAGEIKPPRILHT